MLNRLTNKRKLLGILTKTLEPALQFLGIGSCNTSTFSSCIKVIFRDNLEVMRIIFYQVYNFHLASKHVWPHPELFSIGQNLKLIL